MPKHESLQARSLGMNRAKEVSSSYEVHNVHVKWQIKKERDQKKKKRKETYREKKYIYILFGDASRRGWKTGGIFLPP